MYNAEKYIANCLDSILNSDLPKDEYEVIIVNDGSTDNGPTIAQKYISEHENFMYLTQENQGQSVARNKGIELCNGEYIWFVDADDMISHNVTEVFQQLLDNNTLDILAFRLKIVTENGHFVRNECSQPNVLHEIPISGRDAIISGYNPSSVCALWIRKQFLLDNDLFFKVGITHQDVELSYRMFATAEQVIFTAFTPYRYIMHSDSTSQSINPQKKIKYLSDDIVVYYSFKELAKQIGDDKELSSVINYRAQNIIFSLVYLLYCHRRDWEPVGINIAVLNKLKENNLYPLRGPFDSWKKRLASFWYNFEKNLI